MEEKAKTREVILKTALDLFALQGFESTGVQEIVNKSGITKPTLYHHFGNKRGLLDAIITEWGSQLFEIVERDAEYNHDIVMNLTVLTRDIISFALANQAFFRFQITLSSGAPDSVSFMAYQPLRVGINGCVEHMFNLAIADHGNMKGREKAYSETFIGMTRTWAMLVLNKEITLDDAMLTQAVHQFMHGIFS
ncbi:MAG TPA: helix-turn-helix domain-containing protein [Treponemataceae bacterium]|nr:helix-turn-helix domain-containing protein [Treponemataceae bacterium]